MRGSWERSFGAFSEYLRFLLDTQPKTAVIVSVVAVLLNVPIAVNGTALKGWSHPIADLYAATSLLLLIAFVATISAYIGDMQSGSYTLFLSQPISKTAYVVAWALSAVMVPATAYMISIAAPLIILDARLVALNISDIALLLLEILEFGFVLFAVATTTRMKGLVLAIALLLYLVLPFLGFIALSFQSNPAALALLATAVCMRPFHISRSMPREIIEYLRQYIPETVLVWLAPFTVLLLSIALTMVYARRRFEVR